MAEELKPVAQQSAASYEEQVQLFTRAGLLVTTIGVSFSKSWPSMVGYDGKKYVLENGRYVEAQDA